MPFVLLLLLMLAVRQIQAGPILYPTALMEDGVPLAAFNFVQDTLQRPHVIAIRYARATDRFYWKGPVTGKEMSMDRERFAVEIWRPYYQWTEAKLANPVELAENGDATKAFNNAQNTRDAVAYFKAMKEGRPAHEWPNVDRVWYDDATQLFHWTGPASGQEMSMGREQFIKEIWYPYFLWVDSHSWY